jgi:hypothetical protein
MFPRRRLYRTTIINTGMEVINTASKGGELTSTPVKPKNTRRTLPKGKRYTDINATRLGRRAEMTARMVEFAGVLKAPAPAKPMIMYITQEMMRESQMTRWMLVDGWTLLTKAGTVVTWGERERDVRVDTKAGG